MFRVTVENINPEENPRVYVVGEKEKNFLIKALSGRNISIEEIFIDDEQEL